MDEVLDASALLAWLQNEPGADRIVLEGARINSVNWSEVLQKSRQAGVDTEGMREAFEVLGVRLQAFGLEEAAVAADLYPVTRPHGLSLADRACLATALVHDAVAVTTDRSWTRLVGVRVRQLRP